MKPTKTPKSKSPARRDTRRRIEQLAHNPLCDTNVLSVVHDVPMDQVAAHAGLEPRFGQSRFAITRGLTFEKRLLAEGAAGLIDDLVRAKVLPVGASGLVDLRLRLAGGPIATLDDAHEATLALLHRMAADPTNAPALVAGATLRVPGGALLPDGMVALDLVAVRATPHSPEGLQATLSIGEIKVYPDRGGHTERGKLATARAQAGLYLHLLRETLRDEAPSLHASDHGFLVLSRAGQNAPRLRASEDLRFQARRAEVAIARLRDAVAALPSAGPLADERRRLELIADAPKHYCDGCASFCDLADRCHDQAEANGDPVVLGPDARRELGAISIPRALALLAGEAPAAPAEHDLLRRLGGAR